MMGCSIVTHLFGGVLQSNHDSLGDGEASEELAQNGVQRKPVPNPLGGARRTLCASTNIWLRRAWGEPTCPNAAFLIV